MTRLDTRYMIHYIIVIVSTNHWQKLASHSKIGVGGGAPFDKKKVLKYLP